MKKKVLICGASGFIGRNLFLELGGQEGFDVRGTFHTRHFDPNHPRLFQADLTSYEEALRATRDVDVIIQAAATTSGVKEVMSTPAYHVTHNAVMNAWLFRAAYENKVPHLIFLSCSIMYPPLDRPVQETDLNLNDEIYDKYFGPAWTKIYNEKMCEFYSRLGRTRYTVIRHSNIYGPYDKFDLERSHFFGATVAKVMNCQNGKIVVWGEGRETRDLLYISDLVRFVDLVLDRSSEPFEIYNVGYGKTLPIREIIQEIIRASGKSITIEFDKTKPTLQNQAALDISKAKSRFGWTPEVSLGQGIHSTLSWYQEHCL